MNKEQIYKLDTTIKKRLGIKANRIWRQVIQDLAVINLIKENIKRETRYEPIKLENGNYNLTFYYEYVSKQLNDEAIEYLTNWIKANIDKERLKEWLENDK